ncbi:hypothetical protein L209DRAFT_352166 [Thermothelomyces heterothallicus CBS 203.75]
MSTSRSRLAYAMSCITVSAPYHASVVWSSYAFNIWFLYRICAYGCGSKRDIILTRLVFELDSGRRAGKACANWDENAGSVCRSEWGSRTLRKEDARRAAKERGFRLGRTQLQLLIPSFASQSARCSLALSQLPAGTPAPRDFRLVCANLDVLQTCRSARASCDAQTNGQDTGPRVRQTAVLRRHLSTRRPSMPPRYRLFLPRSLPAHQKCFDL